MTFGQWIHREYGVDEDSTFTIGDMENAFYAGRSLEFTLEQLDRIAAKAAESMCQEFAEMDEDHLKTMYPSIATGIVEHVVKAIR